MVAHPRRGREVNMGRELEAGKSKTFTGFGQFEHQNCKNFTDTDIKLNKSSKITFDRSQCRSWRAQTCLFRLWAPKVSFCTRVLGTGGPRNSMGFTRFGAFFIISGRLQDPYCNRCKYILYRFLRICIFFCSDWVMVTPDYQ